MNTGKTSILGALSTRLTLAFFLILALVGLTVFVVNQVLMRMYFEEFNQKLNASIAMYINSEYALIQQQGGTADIEAIKSLAQTAMVINPAAEVFVLNIDGDIIGHNFPQESIVNPTIPLQPVKNLIAGNARYPYRNTDPRNQNTKKVFSAAEIRIDEELQGYVYVILGGAMYDNLEDTLLTSYSRTQGLIAITFIVFFAGLASWLIFRLMARPLSQLSDEMKTFSLPSFANMPAIEQNEADHTDEVLLIRQRFRQMREKINQQFDLLTQADQVKRELISNVSHDLRTPLASIQGYLETLYLKNSVLTESERSDYLNIAMKSSRRLGSLVGDLFELSKLESNQIKPAFEQFCVAELVHDIVQEFSLDFEKKNIKCKTVIDQRNTIVYADISMIQRVFENLIRNAIAHTPESGEVILTIEPANTSVHRSLKISVGDNGEGISPEDLPHIFDRFYSCQREKRQDVVSSGLGLAIVKRILELHKAEINVRSEINQGTRFEFYLSMQAA